MILTSITEATENKVQFLNLAYTVKRFQCHSNNSLQLLELKGKNNNKTTTKQYTLLASERSERDTYRGKNEKIGDVCLFIYMDVCMSFCTLTLHIFVFAPRSTPSQTSLNRILRFGDHYPYHLRN